MPVSLAVVVLGPRARLRVEIYSPSLWTEPSRAEPSRAELHSLGLTLRFRALGCTPAPQELLL